ncbi:MAG TPA: hypothetical protein VNJ51_05305 [Candidatus Dormibacteraeota bacterium]|nr:hypothetical protein [Candidatus Dormibacteraeota bacterium]
MAHVFYEVEVACAPDHVAERLKEGLAPRAADPAGEADIVYELEVPFENRHLTRIGRLSRKVQMHLGALDQRPDATLLPISWRVPESRAFPEFHGWIETAPISSMRTHLAILGDYTPPLGLVGSVIDAIGGHLVAELTVRRFVERLRLLLGDDRSGNAHP